LAGELMEQAAARSDDPVWVHYARSHRAQLLSGHNRSRQYHLAVAVAETVEARVETRGFAQLTAALSAASQGMAADAHSHLDEAASLAEQLETDVSLWGQTNFGRTNVGIWRVAIELELGDPGKAAELGQRVEPGGISATRQGAFYCDYGRALLAEPGSRDRGVAALLTAERVAPQKIRNNAFVREVVADRLRHTRSDSGGRELRGLAWRMGVAPVE